MTPRQLADLPAELRARSAIPVALDLLRTWAAIGAVWSACLAARGSDAAPLLWAAGALLIGLLQYHIFILGHHAIHRDLSADPERNDGLARWLLFGPQGAPLTLMRCNHLHHHRRVGHPDDQDSHYYDLALRHGRFGFLAWLAGSLAGGMLAPVAKKLLGWAGEGPRGRDAAAIPASDLLAIAVWQLALATGSWSLTGGLWAYAVLWVLPLPTIAGTLNALRTCLEHADPPARLGLNPDYTFVSGRLERLLMAPFNMNFHAEHHRFVAVPYYRLPALREHLMACQDFGPARLESSYRSRLRQLWARL